MCFSFSCFFCVLEEPRGRIVELRCHINLDNLAFNERMLIYPCDCPWFSLRLFFKLKSELRIIEIEGNKVAVAVNWKLDSSVEIGHSEVRRNRKYVPPCITSLWYKSDNREFYYRRHSFKICLLYFVYKIITLLYSYTLSAWGNEFWGAPWLWRSERWNGNLLHWE